MCGVIPLVQGSSWKVLTVVLYGALPDDTTQLVVHLGSFNHRAVKRSQRVEVDGSGPIAQYGWRYATNPTSTLCR